MSDVKMKPSKRSVNAPQKHLHSRISYLYQAATYLTQRSISQQKSRPLSEGTKPDQPDIYTGRGEGNAAAAEGFQKPKDNAALGNGDIAITQRTANLPLSNAVGLPRYLLSHARTVSMKSQVRLSSTMKHSICKRCDILLVPGSTSTSRLENRSRGGKKPWADVLVIKCNLCGTIKRLPVGVKQQSRRTERSGHSDKSIEGGPIASVEISGHS